MLDRSKIRRAFSKSLDPNVHHFAAHSHHPWPDVTREAHLRYWEDSAELLDEKWGKVFSEVMDVSRQKLGELMGGVSSKNIIEGQNTQELVCRVFSSLDFSKPIKILTTDSEFYSFERLTRRWEEFDSVSVQRVPMQPFESFEERFLKELERQEWSFVYLSWIAFNSGYDASGVLPSLEKWSRAREFVPACVDAYHALGATPVDLSSFPSLFLLGGGYKYLSAGEGACFMVVPEGVQFRPAVTGWFADYGALSSEKGLGTTVSYPDDAFRFAGSTFDPTPWYRFLAVMELWESLELTPTEIHEHVRKIQSLFLRRLDEEGLRMKLGRLIGFEGFESWGNFLCFEREDAHPLKDRLAKRRVICDSRSNFIRFGFGYYHFEEEIEKLVEIIREPDLL